MASGSRQTIVVGASEINRRILENCFVSFDYPVPTFVGGAPSALQEMNDHRFALTIVNKQLPDMSGVDFAWQLRSREEYRYTPVLLIGEGFTREDIIKAIETGVNQVLLMPITTPELEKKVKAARKMGR